VGRLETYKAQSSNMVWCTIGDFNCVRRLEERQGEMEYEYKGGECREFNYFIGDMEVEDIPLEGRGFTWYVLNGKAKSLPKRIMVS